MAEPAEVPRLAAGERYLLRRWELTDAPLVREASRDPYIPLVTTVPAVYSRAAGEAFIRRQWGRAASGAGCPFVIERTADHRPLGAIGLWLAEVEAGRASLGYWLAASVRGHGVAAQALGAVTSWAFAELGIPRLHLFVEPWNAASARTARRAGFRCEGLLRGWQRVGDARRDMLVYGLLAADAP